MVMLVFGDLGVGQQLESLLESRRVEDTPWRRRQFVVFVMGLFHVKMACADALWRIYLKSGSDTEDPLCLEKLVQQIRPLETKRIKSNPGFRRMHEVIQWVGAVERLNCWRIMVQKHTPYQTLEDFAASKPSYDVLEKLATRLSLEYVCDIGRDIESIRPLGEEDKSRDLTFENSLRRQQLFLLYEEITWAMNEGDIGRVEECFVPWMWIFRATGKHRYAKFLQRYLRDMHFTYARFPRLRRAIRFHILVNPTGKKGKWRGVDWVIELNNFYIKRIYGGKFSNHTKKRIIEESALIGVYKNARKQVEWMFQRTHQTTRHTIRDLKGSFKKLSRYLQDHKANDFIEGRSGIKVEDVLDIGAAMAFDNLSKGHESEEGDGEVLESGDFEV
ncbi:hypothetical protein MPER_10117 [Moniliophthora perniciosa FA553]|nr:hypothetical protein MPER_10117 [Moniliophthora perniciosa FA553]